MVKVVAAVKLLVACVKIACLGKKAVAGTARRDLSIWGGFKALLSLAVSIQGRTRQYSTVHVCSRDVCLHVRVFGLPILVARHSMIIMPSSSWEGTTTFRLPLTDMKTNRTASIFRNVQALDRYLRYDTCCEAVIAWMDVPTNQSLLGVGSK